MLPNLPSGDWNENLPDPIPADDGGSGSGTPLHSARGRRGSAIPPVIPDHELLRVIGQGAYGEVWLARNVMGTYRAVKVVYRDTFESDRPYEREFDGIQSFEPISRSHESQVDILHIGRNPAQPYFYYVMELADDAGRPDSPIPPFGRNSHPKEKGTNQAAPRQVSPLDPERYVPKTLHRELKRQGRFSFAEALEVSVALATAVEHLHKHGLIHRDIKPTNVIFVNGRPKLADIGLVTESGEALSFVGTEGYLPPEGPGSVQADIYSLGKTLYEVATGKDRLEFPELPTLMASSAEEKQFFELNEVLLTACHPDTQKRYPTASALHADLVLLQAGFSLRRAHALERRFGQVRKVTVGVALLALLAVGAYSYQQAQTREAIRQKQISEDLAARMQIQNAENLFARRDSAQALAHLAQVLRRQPDNRVAAERIMAALTQRSFPRLVSSPLEHEARLEIKGFHMPARLSPDGERILTVCEDYSVHVWNAQTRKESIPPLRHKEIVYSAEFSPDGKKLVTASDDRTVCVMDVFTGRLVFAPLQHPRAVLHAVFSPDGRRVATASLDGLARIFDAETGELVSGPFVHVTPVNAVAFSPDSQQLATAMEGGRVRIWYVNSGHQKHLLRVDGPVYRVRFSGNGKWVAATIYQKHATAIWRVQVWNVESGEPVTGPLLHQNQIYSLEFSPDSHRLVTATREKVARVWRVETGEELFQLPHASMVYSAVYSPDGRQILTASVDRTARLWDATTGAAIAEAMRHDGRVIHAEFSRDGSRVLTAGWEDKMAKLWETGLGRPLPTTLPHKASVMSAEFGASGQEVITATGGAVTTAFNDNLWDFGVQQFAMVWDVAAGVPKVAPILPLKAEAVVTQFTQTGPKALVSQRTDQQTFAKAAWIWDLAKGTPIGKELEHQQAITCAHFSLDGLKLATGSRDGVVMVWDARQGVPLTPPLTNQGRLRAVRFSPDATKLIAASARNTAMIWDVTAGQSIGEPLRHDAGVWFAQFSPKGDKVVTASLDYTVRIWSTNGVPIAKLQHSAPVEYAEFNAGGDQIVTASGDQARLWSAVTGRQLTEPLQHAELVMTARVSGDGRRLITASKDGTAQLWDAQTSLKLADPFRHSDWVVSASFSPDGRWAVTASLDRSAKIWEVPLASTPVPPWLAELAEAVAGQRLNQDRIPEPVSWTEYAALKARLTKTSGTDDNVRWAKRFFDDARFMSGGTRKQTASPNAGGEKPATAGQSPTTNY